jgi:hypothetical protein
MELIRYSYTNMYVKQKSKTMYLSYGPLNLHTYVKVNFIIITTL